MIVNRQLLSGRASRVLIIVPASLLHQWLVEMLRRFNIRFALYDEERIANCDEGNPFEQEQLVLCALELFEDAPETRQAALDAPWDLMVVDEAHHLHWSPEEPGADYLFIAQLAQKTRGLLLLTATPEQVGQASHFARLQLLDPDRYHDLETFVAEEQGYRQLGDIIDALEQGQRPALPAGIDPQLPATAIISQLLDRHGTGRVLFRNTRNAVKGFPERFLHRHPLPTTADYPINLGDVGESLYPELAYTDESWTRRDPRVAWLESFLKQLRPEKALVICAHAETAVALEHYLHLRAGIRSAAFYEGLSIVERDRAAAYFADIDGGAQTLVCSEIGSEGRNFQFVSQLILFDLPINPDLLEQRIGRLDRIGQLNDVQIHVPYIEGSAQETLVDWYDQGLNLFCESCSAGSMILERFRKPLRQQLAGRDDTWAKLLEDTRLFTEHTRQELREGRDRLLERNSLDEDKASDLISSIEAFEQGDNLASYLTLAFDVYGVDADYHSEGCLVLKPSDHMRTAQFPHLPDEGCTITYRRDTALAREDMAFMSWEHPMVSSVLDMVQSTELGNATIGTISLKGVPPGTLLLEILYTINCIAPAELQLERFLSISPMRLLINAKGKDLSSAVSHQKLNSLVRGVKKHTAVAILKQIASLLETKLERANELASTRLRDTLSRASTELRSTLGAELERLIALQQVNPAIRDEELAHLRYRIEESAAHIDHATLQLQALRLIVTN